MRYEELDYKHQQLIVIGATGEKEVAPPLAKLGRASRTESAAAGKAVESRSTKTAGTQLAKVDQEMAEIKAYLDPLDDDPPLWSLRKKLVSLWNKRRERLAQ